MAADFECGIRCHILHQQPEQSGNMHQQVSRILFLTGLISLLVFGVLPCAAQATQTPEAKSIYNEALRELSRGSYYFKLHAVYISSGTTVADETSEVFAPKTDGLISYPFPTVLLARNGEPISDKDIERQRKDVAKRLAKYEESAGKTSISPESRVKVFQLNNLIYIRLPLYQAQLIPEAADMMEFTDLHKEMLNGRECYVFIARYRTDSDFDYLSKYGKYVKESYINAKEFEIISWVDVADKQVSRTELYDKPKQSAKEFIGKPIVERENAAFSVKQYVRTEEGRWMPKHSFSQTKDANGKVVASIEYSYSDYKFFATEVTGATVNDKTP